MRATRTTTITGQGTERVPVTRDTLQEYLRSRPQTSSDPAFARQEANSPGNPAVNAGPNTNERPPNNAVTRNNDANNGADNVNNAAINNNNNALSNNNNALNNNGQAESESLQAILQRRENFQNEIGNMERQNGKTWAYVPAKTHNPKMLFPHKRKTQKA